MNSPRILVVGAGFSGAVVGRELAETLGARVLVIDERSHIAGNCFTERDGGSGVMVHKYGPHIFHTENEEVWNYVRRFGEFGPYINRVKASIARGVFSLPINLHTINQFFGRHFSPAEARTFLAGLGKDAPAEPQNFEEQALRMLGRELYEAFFYGYTRKQWGCEPRELPAWLLKRLPVRFDYNDAYYDDPFQGIPRDGYTALIARMLEHPLVEVKLETRWDAAMAAEFEHVIFTGPLDQFYGYRFGRLGYRTVSWERLEVAGDFQGNALMNYPGREEPFTRRIEHKHFAPWESHARTVVDTEFSRETGPGDTPFYPKGLEADQLRAEQYRAEARGEKRVSFLGRLATYRYLDMDQVIGEALEFAPRLAGALREGKRRPVLAGE